jgi:HPr kinase/phosphorylase
MIVNLENWDDAKDYNRLGLTEEKRRIFDTEIVYLNIPITEARNTATLVEAAANDFKSKRLGYNSASDFNDALNEKIRKNARNDE